MRLQRVEAMLMRAIAEVILFGNLRDPRLCNLSNLSVTGVRVAADLSHARVFVDILDKTTNAKRVIQGLQAAAPAIRKGLATHVKLKRLPYLQFEIDQSIQAGLAIERALAEIAAEGPESKGMEDSKGNESSSPLDEQ